jgi:hypothetical protein
LQVNASHKQGHVAADHIADEHALASVRELCYDVHVLGRSLIKA